MEYVNLFARRETGLTPNGNEINNRWVVRDATGEFITVDRYSNDLELRYSKENGYNLVFERGEEAVVATSTIVKFRNSENGMVFETAGKFENEKSEKFACMFAHTLIDELRKPYEVVVETETGEMVATFQG